MAAILFYSPFNQRSRDTESLMIAFQKQGHKVMSLSQQEGFQIHDVVSRHGVDTYSHVVSGQRSGWRYYLRHLIFFVRFCRRHKPDIIYSHLEPANFVASIGQHFVPGKVYLCRHHIDEGQLYQFDKDLYYRITYRQAKNIIVVSDHARQYMIEKEGIPADKIRHINLAYDFNLYAKPSTENIEAIRAKFSCKVLLVSACRLTEYKRPDLAVHLLKALVSKKIDAKLVLLGKGEMHDAIMTLVNDLKLKDRVEVPGFVDNALDYMAAADFFVHPSVLDSSCVAVKEAGLVRTPVLVCKGIGDFNDYIVHGKNGFAVSKDQFVESAADIVIQYQHQRESLIEIGDALHNDVLRLFDIKNILPQYTSLNEPGQ